MRIQRKQSFDAVVNCSYANINTLTTQLGYEVREGQYEYTVVPIISLDIPPTSITIMDGPFMTLFPYGKTKKFLLYHVDYSVIKTEITKTLNRDWLDPHKSPFSSMDRYKYFDTIVKVMQKSMFLLLRMLNYAVICNLRAWYFLNTSRMTHGLHL